MSYLAPPLAALLLLGLVCRVGGGLVARLLGDTERDVGSTPPALAELERWCLGLAAVTLGLFALAAAGALRPWPLVVAAVLVLGVGAVVAVRGPRRALRPPAAGSLAALALLPVVLPLALLAASPTVSWDAAAYHLALPRLYLEAGGFRSVPANVYAKWPLGVELLFAPALAMSGVAAAKLVHWGFGILLGLALAAPLGRLGRGGPAVATVALLLVLANPLVGFEMRVAYVDLAVSFFFLAGVVFLWRAVDRPRQRRRWLRAAGIAAALLVSSKVTGILLAALLALLALFSRVRRGRGGGGDRRELAVAFAVPVAIAGTLWAAKAWWETGNPVYPFLHDLFGGPWWSAELGAKLAAWQGSIGMGREPLDYLLLPVRVFLAGGEGYDRFDGRLSAFWLLLVPASAVFAWRGAGREARLARRALGAAGLVFVAWAATAQQMRFLLPALPLLALAAAVTVEGLVRRLARGRRSQAALRTTAVAVALAVALAVHGPLLGTGLRLATVYARVPAEDLVRSAVPPVFRAVADQVPEGSRILFLGTNQRFFCPREVLADSFLEASQIAAWLAPATSPLEIRRRLAAAGIDHLLVDTLRAPAVGYPDALWRLLRDPRAATTLHADPSSPLVLLRLASPGEVALESPP